MAKNTVSLNVYASYDAASDRITLKSHDDPEFSVLLNTGTVTENRVREALLAAGVPANGEHYIPELFANPESMHDAGVMVTFFAEESGAGVTTTAFLFGQVLAAEGKRVLVVDADMASTNLARLSGASGGLSRFQPGDVPVSLEKLSESVSEAPGRVDVFLSDTDAGFTDAQLDSLLSGGWQSWLKDYDYVIVIAPPTKGMVRDDFSYFRKAHYLLNVVLPAMGSVAGMGELLHSLTDYENARFGFLMNGNLNREFSQKLLDEQLHPRVVGVLPYVSSVDSLYETRAFDYYLGNGNQHYAGLLSVVRMLEKAVYAARR